MVTYLVAISKRSPAFHARLKLARTFCGGSTRAARYARRGIHRERGIQPSAAHTAAIPKSKTRCASLARASSLTITRLPYTPLLSPTPIRTPLKQNHLRPTNIIRILAEVGCQHVHLLSLAGADPAAHSCLLRARAKVGAARLVHRWPCSGFVTGVHSVVESLCPRIDCRTLVCAASIICERRPFLLCALSSLSCSPISPSQPDLRTGGRWIRCPHLHARARTPLACKSTCMSASRVELTATFAGGRRLGRR